MHKETEFDSLLREHCLRATAPRLALLSIMEKVKVPQSVRDLQARLKGRIDGVTVYRTLETLHKAGMVFRVDLQRAHAYYELATGRKHHHHLVCNSCGAVEDISYCPSSEMEQKVLKGSRKFSSIQSHALELFGTCTTCV